MNILFLHRNFPAQFKHIAPALAADKSNNVVFITNNENVKLPKIKKIQYSLKRDVHENCHKYLRFYEESIIHAQATAEAAIKLQQKGFKPDIIFGHTWGQTMFMKDIFPEVPLLCYFEWFYNRDFGDMGFDGKPLSIDDWAKLRTKNAHFLIDLYSCDAGICPTEFQKMQFPKEFHHKIKVLHDGIDTDICKPDYGTKFVIKDKNLIFSANDKIITYATRGMEAYRGFPEFMQAMEVVLKRNPNVQVVIAGEDKVCYGPKLTNTSYKKIMLEKLDLDLNRIHFVGNLPYEEYLTLLQISSAHVYLTYPFVTSWSLLEAMACECPIIASSTGPVKEFIQEGKNGLLFDFYNIEDQVKKIEFAINNKDKMVPLRRAARQTILNDYALKDLLPKHIENIISLAKKEIISV